MGSALTEGRPTARWRASLAALGLSACAAAADAPPPAHPSHGEHPGHPGHNGGRGPGAPAFASPATNDPTDRTLEAVRAIHGGAGPWAVAGYRMGDAALRALGLERGSFDVEVVHHTPREVQYSCIADGAAAATGASLGKLNLSLQEAPPDETRTTYRRRSTGQTITLRLTAAFKARFLDVPRDELAEAGRQAAGLPDEAIFERVPDAAATNAP